MNEGDKQISWSIYREIFISLSWFSCTPSVLVELEFGDLGFCGGRKTGEPGEKLPSEQGENQQQTQPTYGTWPES